MITILQVTAGLALLILGRRLFWLALAALGFVAGMTYANDFLPGQYEGTALLIGLAAGVIGALLAIFLQKIAIGAAGFLAGGYLVLGLFRLIDAEPSTLGFVVGGTVGLILIYPLFDWGLIILSSLAGALILVQTFEAARAVSAIVFGVAFVFGLIIQSALHRRRPKPPPQPTPQV
ncbi:MAG: hypothetical protein ACRDHG_00435 [Anaerolineales bacterium]